MEWNNSSSSNQLFLIVIDFNKLLCKQIENILYYVVSINYKFPEK